jgi:predicted lipoprotein with Yx(FWY)xxD motif
MTRLYKEMSAMPTMSTTFHQHKFRWLAVSGILAAGLVATACSSSGGSGSNAAPTAAAPTAAAHNTAQSAVLMTRSGPDGTFLTDGAGKALYLFTSDSSTKSSCTGQCLSYWPIFGGKVKAGSGVQASKLGSITTDGTKQATYAGHPLYYYAGDQKAGDITGQGLQDFGATWWLVTPSGQAITKSAAGSGSSGYGGYGG